MPEIQELFREVTRGARPNPGALERQTRRQRRRANRRKAGVYVLTAFLMVAIGVAGILAASRPGTPEPAKPPPTETSPFGWFVLVPIDGGASTPFALDSARPNATWWRYSPDRSQVAFTEPDARGVGQIWIEDADGTNARQLTTGPRESAGPEWSPDGTRFTFQREDAHGRNQICVLDIATGEVTQLTHHQMGGHALLPKWSPGGTRIVFEYENALYTIDPTGGPAHLLVPPEAYQPEWSSRGELAFVSVKPITGLQIERADGSGLTTITSSKDVSWPHFSPDGTKLAYGICPADGSPCTAWIYDLTTGTKRIFRRDAEVITWKDDRTLVVVPER